MVGGDIYSSITSVGELLVCAGAGWVVAGTVRSRRRARVAAPVKEPATVLDHMIKEYLSSDSWTSTIEFLEKTEKLSPEKCFAPHVTQATFAFGTAAARPAAATSANTGYYATDTGEVTFSDGKLWSRRRESAITAAIMSTPRVAGWAPKTESIRVVPWPGGGGYDVDWTEVNTTTLVERLLRVRVDEKETLPDVTQRISRHRSVVLLEMARPRPQTRLSSASALDDYRPGRVLAENHRQLIGQGMLTPNEVRALLSDSNGRPLLAPESYFHDLVKRDLERKGS